jgi:hypothetical protein
MMPQVNRVKRLPLAVQREVDERLIRNGFTEYEVIAMELAARGYRISKSALGRYGFLLKQKIEQGRAREQAQVAGMPHEIVNIAGSGATLVTIVDRFNGRARVLETDIPMPEIVRLITERRA